MAIGDNSSEKQVRASLTLAGVASAAIFFLWWSADPLPQERLQLGTLLFVIAIVPLALYIIQWNRVVSPIFALNSFSYVLCFAVHAFYMGTLKESSFYTVESMNESLRLACLGLLAQYAGYYGLRPFLASMGSIRFARGMDDTSLLTLAWLTGFIHLAAGVFPSLTKLPLGDQAVAVSGFISPAIFYTLHLLGRLPRIHWYAFFLFFLPFQFGFRAMTGATAQVMLLCLLLITLRYLLVRRVAWVPLLIAFGFFSLLNPIKFQYRTELKARGELMSSVEKFGLIGDLASVYWFSGREFGRDEFQSALLYRFNMLTIFATTVDATPSRVPYWEGETIESVFYAAVPRPLWLNKPKLGWESNDFGHRYGILSELDKDTSINFTWITDFYINFGVPGILGGMFVIGMAFALLERGLGGQSSNPMDLVLAVSITFPLTYPESNLPLSWGSMGTYIIALYMLTRVVSLSGGSPVPAAIHRGRQAP